MPELRWLSLTAVLYFHTLARCVALAEALETVSHDRLTRLLQADGSGQPRLEVACRTLVVWERGDLMIDDPVMATPGASAIEGLAWGFSSRERKPGSGLSLVLRVWPNGTLRLPLGLRLWRPGGPSQSELAVAVLS